MRLVFLFFVVMVFGYSVNAQPWFPSSDEVFRTDSTPRITIYLPQDSLDWLYENTASDHEFKALFVFEAGATIDTVKNVGFRLRGNTSRNSDKKSFKVSFNAFKKGRKYNGQEKMNLNGEHNDPSIIRSFLSWTLCENIQLVGSRSNHVALYINDAYYGLYINVEHIDELFVDKRFGNKGGNLYRCLTPANLDYLGENKTTYKRNGYELKTNVESDDYAPLIDLIKVIDETSIDDLPVKLEPIFNVNGFIRYLALESFIGHWDAYSFGKNNYYLYANEFTKKFEFIPFDVDNTFGIDWYGIDWAKRDIYKWWHDYESRPLTEKVLSNQVYKDRYSYFLNELLTKYANPTSFFPFIDATKERIDDLARNDRFRTLDYGWTFSDFTKSYTDKLGKHVSYGLKPFISERIKTIENQLVLNSISPIIENVYHNYPLLNQDLEITAQISDDDVELASAQVFWSINGSAFVSAPFNNVGGVFYSFNHEGMSVEGDFNYYIEATDAAGNVSRDPYRGEYTIKVGMSKVTLRVNEIMASNSGLIFDNYGQSDDWIELYNYGNDPIFLGDKYLTDDVQNATKWKMPAIELASKQYCILWADDDTKQGAHHANFKLSKAGDFIGVYDSYANDYLPIDTLSFPEQSTNVSYGLNELGNFEALPFISPGIGNENEKVAYVTYAYNVNHLINAGSFNSKQDFIMIAANFNDWEPLTELVDNDEDGIIKASFFGFVANDELAYKAMVNGNAERFELVGGANRSYLMQAGLNELTHTFNDGVGVNEQLELSSKVYPNPVSSGEFCIESSTSQIQYSMQNAIGKVVKSGLFAANKTLISTSGIKQGLYFITIEKADGKMESHKLLVY